MNFELKTPHLLPLAAVLLAGCSVKTPLPLTPIQVIEGTWPPPAVTVNAINRPYTIKGDVFSFPALGLSVTRASQADWAFQARQNAVVVLYRGESEEPKPALLVQILELPAGTDVPGTIAAEKAQLEANGATVAQTERVVSGLTGLQWIVEQTDPASKIQISTLRMYVLLADGRLVAIQAQASKNNFTTLKPEIDKMVDSIVLPGTQTPPAEEAEGA